MTADGVTITTIINGFTIAAGNADGFAPDNGGGGMLIFSASPIVVRSTFTGNFGASRGGAMNIPAEGASSPILVNCSFISNTSGGQGGGAVFLNDSSATFTNCLFSGNVGNAHGGAIYAVSPDSVLTNCTFIGNSAIFADGGGIAVAGGSVTLDNCILWGNTPDQIHAGPDTTIVSFSDVESGLPEDVIDGGGNIDADPMFCQVSNNNYRLQDGSPCIDTGSDAAVPDDIADVDDDGITTETLPWDLDTRIRQFDGDAGGTLVDMGAYENQHDQLCPADLDGDCAVGVKDLLILLGAWGSNPGHPADIDCDTYVGVPDLLVLLGDWGLCPCGAGPPPPSLQEAVEDAGLTWPDDWDEFEEVMTDPESSQEDKDNYYCWMDHYLNHCTGMACTTANCPGDAPFGHHE